MEGIGTLSYADWIPMFYEGSANWRSGECENFTSLGPFNISIAFTCSVCKRGAESCNLKRCTGCLVNTYCSRGCQKKDHPTHRKFCKMIQSMRLTELDNFHIPRSTEQWKRFLLYYFTSDSGDSFHFQFLQHCSVCYATPFFSSSRDVKLTACVKCHLAHRCSHDECVRGFADRHDEISCEKFYIARAALVMNMQQGNVLSVNSITRVSAPLPSSWVSYFHIHPSSISSSHVNRKKIEDFSVPVELLEMPPVMATLTDNLSVPMTILHSLQLIHSTEKLLSFQELEIHVLGATAYETYSVLNRHEEIFHWLPNLRRLKICYIGLLPQMQQSSQKIDRLDGKFCRSCEEVGCTCEVVLLRGLYHDLQQPDEAPVAKADLVIACNSGIHDLGFKSSWYPSLQLLISAKEEPPAVVFTAYDEREIIEDENMLREELGAHVLVSARANPFRGLLPKIDNINHSFYYSNAFFCIIKGSSSK